MAYNTPEEDWDEIENWQPRTVSKLIGRAVHEFKKGRYSKDFEAKLVERGISDQIILDTISSKRSYIVKYRDRYDRMLRIGFWHPRIRIFVAWKPGPKSAFKTCFWRKEGLKYMRERLLCSRPIYRPNR